MSYIDDLGMRAGSIGGNRYMLNIACPITPYKNIVIDWITAHKYQWPWGPKTEYGDSGGSKTLIPPYSTRI